MKKLLFLSISLLFSVAVYAADVELNTRNFAAEVVQDAKREATKVVDELSLNDASARNNVFIVVTNRYLELREIHQKYGERNKAIEALNLDKKAMDERLEVSYYQCNSDLYYLRSIGDGSIITYLSVDMIFRVSQKSKLRDNLRSQPIPIVAFEVDKSISIAAGNRVGGVEMKGAKS